MDVHVSSTPSPEVDQCDQDHDFKTQLLIIAGIAVVTGLGMCLAGIYGIY